MQWVQRPGTGRRMLPAWTILTGVWLGFVLGLAFLSGLFFPSVSSGELFPASRIEFLNDRARDITGASAVNIPGFAALSGLTGEGQIIAIADSGLDIGKMDDLHPDLRSTPGKMPKVVLLKSWAGRAVPDDPNGHGTHMAATVAGTGAASGGRFQGVAPGASIYFQAILNDKGEASPPADLSQLFAPAYEAGARIHIDGWGGGRNTYGQTAVQIDAFVRKHPDFLPVFGAGNSGPSAGTLTTEANSKNALVVGAANLPRPALAPGVSDTKETASFSSRGPAGDGRIKPELLAPASAVISARSRLVESNLPGYPQYRQMQGTSMATAVAGGSAALLREYFKEEANNPAPTAALLRAALVSGAREPAGGPSEEGFGIIDLTATVLGLKDGGFQWQENRTGLGQGMETAYEFTVTDGSAPFKATLVWTDPPGNGGGKALVNDLDLVVETPDGQTFYGNHFLDTNTPDRLNTIEQVRLPAPKPGRYTVRVIARTVTQNTVAGSSQPVQDYALVWGQPPRQDQLQSVSGSTLRLASGEEIGLKREGDSIVALVPDSAAADETETGASRNKTGIVPVYNAIDGELYPADAAHLFPGAAVYRTARGCYLTVRLWRATGVSATSTGAETVFAEINRLARIGGYQLAPAGTVTLNGKPVEAGKLPPGVEVEASINPLDQTAWRVRAAVIEREGFISEIRNTGGRDTISLIRDSTRYPIGATAAYAFADTYQDIDAADLPFGTGALAESMRLLPGMAVRLHLAPSTMEVQYLAVKRQVALGTVTEVNRQNATIKLETGFTVRLFPGAAIRRDGKDGAGLAEVKPGDHLVAVLLPGTGEAVGLIVNSRVVYGKIVDYSSKTRTLYLIDDTNQYRSFSLKPEAVVYRWGVLTGPDALAAGTRVRLVADVTGKVALSLDVAETIYTPVKILKECDPEQGTLTASDGTVYRLGESTRVHKNGLQVPLEALHPGEVVALEYVLAPAPAGPVLMAVDARTTALSPSLQVDVITLPEAVLLNVSSNADTIYFRDDGGSWREIPEENPGRFVIRQPAVPEKQQSILVVAVDRDTGGVAGQAIAPVSENGASVPAGLDIVTQAVMATSGAKYAPAQQTPLTRGAAALALAGLLRWPAHSGEFLPFGDLAQIPAPARPAVASALERGILKGYPDGLFRPQKVVTRAETAVILTAVMNRLGIGPAGPVTSAYTDAARIPAWAKAAVDATTTAGIFYGRTGGSFAPDDPVTVGEMAALFDRLLARCQKSFAAAEKQP